MEISTAFAWWGGRCKFQTMKEMIFRKGLSGAHGLMLSSWKPHRLDQSCVKGLAGYYSEPGDHCILTEYQLTYFICFKDWETTLFKFWAHKCTGYEYFLSLLSFYWVNENTVKYLLIFYVSRGWWGPGKFAHWEGMTLCLGNFTELYLINKGHSADDKKDNIILTFVSLWFKSIVSSIT